MKRALLTFSILVLSTPLWATKISSPNCKELEQVKVGFTPQYLAVIDGFNKKGKLVTDEIDVAGIVAESPQVDAECAKNKSVKIEKVRMGLKSTTTKDSTAANTTNPKPINLNQAKCSDFIALGEQLQPVAAFWVAGNSKKGTKHADQMDEMFLEMPVMTLVEDCTSAPTASFYEKAKLWFKKESKLVKKL